MLSAGEQVTLAVGGVRRRDRPHVGGRVDQQLVGQRFTDVSLRDGHHRRQIATRAVAADGDAARVDAQRRASRRAQRVAAHAVVRRGREAVLGAEPVVDRQHRDAGLQRQLAAQHVVRVAVADGPAAAVEVHQQRQRAGRRPVQPQRDAVGRQVAHLGHRRRLGLRERAPLQVEAARVGRRQRVRGRHAAFDHQVDQGTGLGVEHAAAV